MPGFTPNFAIQYPCAGETIDPTVFQTFADDVEAALSTVDAAATAALQRPRAAIRQTSQSIAFGAMTALTFPTTDFSSGVTAAAAGFTIVTDGIYMATLNAGTNGTTTSVTSWAADFQRAGTIIFRRKISKNPALADAGYLNVVGVFTATVGQAITFRFGWMGAGVNLNIDARATIRKISDL